MIRFHLKRVIADAETALGQRITMEAIAAKTGIHRTTLSRIAGPTPYNTTTDVLDRLCEFFNCRIEDLVQHIPEQKPAEGVKADKKRKS